MTALRTFLARWRFRRMTRHFDRAISQARKEHRAIRHIQAAKTAFLHDCLRGGR